MLDEGDEPWRGCGCRKGGASELSLRLLLDGVFGIVLALSNCASTIGDVYALPKSAKLARALVIAWESLSGCWAKLGSDSFLFSSRKSSLAEVRARSCSCCASSREETRCMGGRTGGVDIVNGLEDPLPETAWSLRTSLTSSRSALPFF